MQKYTFPRELTSEQHIFSRVNLCMYYYYRYKKSSKPSLVDKECLLLFVASDWLASPEDLTCRSRLLSVVLVRYCQLLAAMCAARSQYATTILCSHTLTETMLVHAATIVRLKCSLHCLIIFLFVDIHAFGLQNYSLFLKYQKIAMILAQIFTFFFVYDAI